MVTVATLQRCHAGARSLRAKVSSKIWGRIDSALSFVIGQVDAMAATHELIILRTIRAIRELVDEVRLRLKEEGTTQRDSSVQSHSCIKCDDVYIRQILFLLPLSASEQISHLRGHPVFN